MTDTPDLTQPHGAPDQKARVLEWLQSEPAGLTQLDALQHLAVARLAAIVYRLKHDDGHNIITELVEMPTRYGPAKVARYHLVPPGGGAVYADGQLVGITPSLELRRIPQYRCAVCCDLGKVMDGQRGDGQPFAVPCPAVGCEARALYQAPPPPSRGPIDFDALRRDAGIA